MVNARRMPEGAKARTRRRILNACIILSSSMISLPSRNTKSCYFPFPSVIRGASVLPIWKTQAESYNLRPAASSKQKSCYQATQVMEGHGWSTTASIRSKASRDSFDSQIDLSHGVDECHDEALIQRSTGRFGDRTGTRNGDS